MQRSPLGAGNFLIQVSLGDAVEMGRSGQTPEVHKKQHHQALVTDRLKGGESADGGTKDALSSLENGRGATGVGWDVFNMEYAQLDFNRVSDYELRVNY